jgi:guanylate kinase
MKNKVYVIIGPPASGKTSIVKALRKYGITEFVSHTTRQPKAGEQHGIDYYFVNEDEFRATELIERVTYNGKFYGLAKDEVINKVMKYPVTVVATEVQGMRQIKKLLGERVESICILVDKNTIINRIIERGEDLEQVKKRIEYAEKAGEFDNWHDADYVVKNTGKLDIAIRQILAIMGLVTFESLKIE